MSDSAKRARPAPAGKTEAASVPTEAQRRAAVILEVLAGIRTAQEAAGLLKISSNHYYILERKALAGLVAACQAAPHRGRATDPARQLKKLQQEVERLRRECQRQAALVRATQRAVGLPAVVSDGDGKPRRKRAGKQAGIPARRRRQPRGLRAARALQKSIAAREQPAVQQPSTGHEYGRTPPLAQEQTDDSSRT